MTVMERSDFRTEFVRSPGALRDHPALVLNADYRPLSYYPLSLWSWQEAIKAAWLDRVDIVAEYDHWVRSPSTEIRIPSVIVLKDYVQPQKRVAFTRFNLFFTGRIPLSVLWHQGRSDLRSRGAAGGGGDHQLGKCGRRLFALQPAQRVEKPAPGGHVAAQAAAGAGLG